MISHHHKCIFVHIPKTAGQSVEHVFLNLLGLTWETRAPLLLRPNDRPELGPPRLAHLTAQEYVSCRYLPQEMFDQYFKFAFVRNPWSRLVSIYKYLKFDQHIDFKTFVMREFQNHVMTDHFWFARPQSDFLYDANGELLVDFVGRFEQLQDDFSRVCQKIGLPDTELPHVNASSKGQASSPAVQTQQAGNVSISFSFSVSGDSAAPATSSGGFRDHYDAESREVVARVYQRDIELLGYSFD